MLAAITAFFAAIPEIISVIKSLIQFIKDAETAAEQKALAQKFASAIQTSVNTGNTSELENIFKTGNL